jgi:hypothetical protein
MRIITVVMLLALFSCKAKLGKSFSPHPVPSDLKTFNVIDFFEPTDILRIWRFPEGGIAFEEMIQVTKNGDNFQAIKYTYLMDEFRDKKDLAFLRKRISLTDTAVLDKLPKLFTKEILSNDNGLNPNQEFLEDLFLIEFRSDTYI